jgi:hypothetical protein
MQHFVKYATTVALLGALAPAAARAQEVQQSTFFKAPVFVLQPGGVTANAISAPDGVDAVSAFNARFATILPTPSPWISGVFGAQVATGGNATTPNIFYGGIIPIVPISTATGGLLDVSLDPLGVTTFGGTTTQASGTYFVGEIAVVLQVGKMLMGGMGPTWSGIGLYFLIDQTISGPLPRNDDGDADRWRPVLLYGLNIPIGSGR